MTTVTVPIVNHCRKPTGETYTFRDVPDRVEPTMLRRTRRLLKGKDARFRAVPGTIAGYNPRPDPRPAVALFWAAHQRRVNRERHEAVERGRETRRKVGE